MSKTSTPRRRRHREPGYWVPSALQTAVLWGMALLFIVPLAWFFLSSFKPAGELFRYPLTMFPENWSVAGYETAWSRYDFALYFRNTAVVAIVTTVLTVIVSAMTGFAFAKYKNRWLKVFFICILATTMLPTEVIMPSTFIVIRDLGLYNQLAGVIVPSIITATGIFMFRQYYRSVPDELLEAARIDGASEMRIFWSMMLPLAKPIAFTLAIFSFHWRWNDFIWPLLVLNNPNLYTLQVALRSIVGAENIDWSVLLSASVISIIPMGFVFILFQKYILNADLNSGLKG